jgi:cytochrome c-type biogenesis protein CcmH/NrfG
MGKIVALFAIATGLTFAQDTRQAASLYARTDYESALALLRTAKAPDAEQLALMGKCYLMLGEFKKATASFQKAVALDPRNADYVMWLGRSWGRRAETASPFIAPSNAAKARDCFEKALALDPNNRDALGDLFDYYLDAPGFLGGGSDKAEGLARRIEAIDPPEGHFLLSEVARKRQQPGDAERELRLAVRMAPTQVGHVIALARFLARQARLKESDAVLAQADRVAPGSPRVLYGKASIYIESHRNLDQARALLEKYLQSQLTPDDPPREAAEKLLKTAKGA